MIEDGTGKCVFTFHSTTHSNNYLKYTEGYLTTNIKLLDTNSHTHNNIRKKCIQYPSGFNIYRPQIPLSLTVTKSTLLLHCTDIKTVFPHTKSVIPLMHVSTKVVYISSYLQGI